MKKQNSRERKISMRNKETNNTRHWLTVMMLVLSASAWGQETFTRMKGYYRVWQTTNDSLTYFWDGYMEVYVPDGYDETSNNTFCDRKILGERHRSAAFADGNDLFMQMGLPNPETTPLIESVTGDEYSTRSNGDIYFLKYKAGHIEKTDSLCTITMDELAGRPDHSLDMSQLKMYGFTGTMTAFDETETYTTQTGRPYTLADMTSSSKRQTLNVRRTGGDEKNEITIVSQLYITDRQKIDKAQLKKIKKEKTRKWEFTIPTNIPPLDSHIAEQWMKMK